MPDYLDPVFENASIYAQQVAGDMISNINATTLSQVRQILGMAVDEQWNLEELTDALNQADLFGPMRARLIAVTETTNVYQGGAQFAQKELNGMGLDTVLVWSTVRDAAVCSICEPRDGKAQGDGWDDVGAAHPGCRCDVIIKEREDQAMADTYPLPRFANVEDAQKWALENGLAGHVDYYSITPDAANIINEEIYKTFGNNSPIRRIITGAGQSGDLGIMMEMTDDLDLIIYDIASDPNDVINALVENQLNYVEIFGEEAGDAFLARDYRELVIHELGHALDFTYSKTQRLKRFWYAERIGARQDLSWEMLNQGVLSALSKAEAGLISDYATNNMYEYFAESYLAVMTGRGDLVPDYVMEILNEVIN